MSIKPQTITASRANWRGAVLVCRKCQRKLDDEGFGPKGKDRLAKAMKQAVKASPAGRGAKLKGRRAPVGIVEVDCLKLCPKRGVTVVSGARPDRWLVAGVGTSAEAVLVEAGIDLITPTGSRRRPPPDSL
jgi:predicted metal-binding protein